MVRWNAAFAWNYHFNYMRSYNFIAQNKLKKNKNKEEEKEREKKTS